MKDLKLKNRYIGFKLHKDDNRFRADLSQDEIQQLISIGFKDWFEEVGPKKSLLEKVEENVRDYIGDKNLEFKSIIDVDEVAKRKKTTRKRKTNSNKSK